MLRIIAEPGVGWGWRGGGGGGEGGGGELRMYQRRLSVELPMPEGPDHKNAVDCQSMT